MEDICTACDRESLDCSLDPCPDVIADRGELWRVTFIAEGIQVTSEESDDEDGPDPGDEADKYAKEDAAQFRTSWNYAAPEIEQLDEGEELTESEYDIELEVACTENDGELYTYQATFSLVVEGATEEAAITEARRIMGL